LNRGDRLLWLVLRRLWSRWASVLVIVKPEAVVRWHRAGFRWYAKQHFRQFSCARRTIQGYETIHKIRKGQVRWLRKGDIRLQNRFIDQAFGLAA
jgi:hypothetical protein